MDPCRSSCWWMMDKTRWWRRCWTPTCSSFRSTSQPPPCDTSLQHSGSLCKRSKAELNVHIQPLPEGIISLYALTSSSLSAVPQRVLPGQGGPVWLPVPRDPQVLQPSLQLHPDGGSRSALFFHEEELWVHKGKVYSPLTSAGQWQHMVYW